MCHVVKKESALLELSH